MLTPTNVAARAVSERAQEQVRKRRVFRNSVSDVRNAIYNVFEALLCKSASYTAGLNFDKDFVLNSNCKTE